MGSLLLGKGDNMMPRVQYKPSNSEVMDIKVNVNCPQIYDLDFTVAKQGGVTSNYNSWKQAGNWDF